MTGTAVMNVYTIMDRLAQECGPVFESKNDQTALRGYKLMLRKEQGNPSEYRLLRIGSIDHETVKFEILDEPVEVVVFDAKEIENA